MSFKCDYTGEKGCLCDVCRSMRKAMEEAEKITDEEVNQLFKDANEMLKQMEIQESEKK